MDLMFRYETEVLCSWIDRQSRAVYEPVFDKTTSLLRDASWRGWDFLIMTPTSLNRVRKPCSIHV